LSPPPIRCARSSVLQGWPASSWTRNAHLPVPDRLLNSADRQRRVFRERRGLLVSLVCPLQPALQRSSRKRGYRAIKAGAEGPGQSSVSRTSV
jgi:hypothetical protein